MYVVHENKWTLLNYYSIPVFYIFFLPESNLIQFSSVELRWVGVVVSSSQRNRIAGMLAQFQASQTYACTYVYIYTIYTYVCTYKLYLMHTSNIGQSIIYAVQLYFLLVKKMQKGIRHNCICTHIHMYICMWACVSACLRVGRQFILLLLYTLLYGCTCMYVYVCMLLKMKLLPHKGCDLTHATIQMLVIHIIWYHTCWIFQFTFMHKFLTSVRRTKQLYIHMYICTHW